MNSHSAAAAYKREAIETAPPVKVVQMLYAGALRHLDRALASDPSQASSPFVESLSRADEIVVELRLALDAQAAPELASSLQRLYFFVESRIGEALATRELEPVRAAREVLHTLQQGWAGIELDPGAASELGGPA